MDERIFVVILLSIVLFSDVVGVEQLICNEGCPRDPNCPNYAPYRCQVKGVPPEMEMCVVKGFDAGNCGGYSEDWGYCFKCSGGCKFVSTEGSCGDLWCTEDKPYCCRDIKAAHWEDGRYIIDWEDYSCVERHYDCGCCGGTEKPGEYCLTSLKFEITNSGTEDRECNLGKNHDSFNLWIDENCKGEFKPYTGVCIEREDITVEPGETVTVTCSSDEIPRKITGPHCGKAEWCGLETEFKYGGPIEIIDFDLIIVSDRLSSVFSVLPIAKKEDVPLLIDGDYENIKWFIED